MSSYPQGGGQYGQQQTQQQQPVAYQCGLCGADVYLRPSDVIVCQQCGYRIIYKKRTKKIVQLEAR